jgi:hypothetical protein
VIEVVAAEGEDPPLVPPLSDVAAFPGVSPATPDESVDGVLATGTVVVVVAVEELGGVAYCTLGGVPSNALTMVGSVPVSPRAHIPKPPMPYWVASREIWYIDVWLSKNVSCHWVPTW